MATTFLRERFMVGAQAIAVRLRLSAMMQRRSLPEILGALTPGASTPGAPGSPSASTPGAPGSPTAGSPMAGSPGSGGEEESGRFAPLPVVEQAIAAAEGLLGRIPAIPDTCLYRSLARYAVLRSAGYPARFFMGIEPHVEELTGHAWVELNGEPRGETVDPGLVVTYSYPPPAADSPPPASAP